MTPAPATAAAAATPDPPPHQARPGHCDGCIAERERMERRLLDAIAHVAGDLDQRDRGMSMWVRHLEGQLEQLRNDVDHLLSDGARRPRPVIESFQPGANVTRCPGCAHYIRVHPSWRFCPTCGLDFRAAGTIGMVRETKPDSGETVPPPSGASAVDLAELEQHLSHVESLANAVDQSLARHIRETPATPAPATGACGSFGGDVGRQWQRDRIQELDLQLPGPHSHWRRLPVTSYIALFDEAIQHAGLSADELQLRRRWLNALATWNHAGGRRRDPAYHPGPFVAFAAKERAAAPPTVTEGVAP